MARGDLTSATTIYVKGFLFLALGVLAVAILVLQNFSLQFAGLLAIAIWSFCRAYYFAFYVIEHYVDSRFQFSGLIDFARYMIGWRRP